MRSPLRIAFLMSLGSLVLYAGIIPDGSSVEIKPLVQNYTVTQELQNSTQETSHTANATIVHNDSDEQSNEDNKSVQTRDKGTEAAYEENYKRTNNSSTDTVMVEKVMHTNAMTSAIETALHNSDISISPSGDYVASGYVKAMRCSEPKLIPDGSKSRYSLQAVSTIHLQIAHKTTGKVIFAKTLTGTGQQTFNGNHEAPIDDTIELSIEDLTSKITEALGGKKHLQETDYQDSPGKRLKD